MPGPALRWLIVLGWLAATAWWFVRDVAPWLGADKLGYRQLLAQRASDETTNWRVLIDGKQVGSILSGVQPKTDGAFGVWSQAMLKSSELTFAVGLGKDADVSIHLSADISPLGRLTDLEVRLSLRSDADSRTDFASLRGKVVGDELELQPAFNGQVVGQPIKLSYDPSTPIAGEFSPTDKLPGLWVGRRWTTQIVDPQAVLLGGGLLKTGPPTREVVHSVVGVETIVWNQTRTNCFVVDDRHGDKIGKTWVRRSDGVVLRQQANFGRSTIVMELDPRPMQQSRRDTQ